MIKTIPKSDCFFSESNHVENVVFLVKNKQNYTHINNGIVINFKIMEQNSLSLLVKKCNVIKIIHNQ